MLDCSLPALRVAACREDFGDGKEWSFYLINDGGLTFKWATLVKACYEWADHVTTEQVDARVSDLPAASHVLLWRTDGDGAEFRQNLLLEFASDQGEGSVWFEFPKLYRKREFALVSQLQKRGWEAKPNWRLSNP
ncbi:MAG: hypothetical protein KF779_16435 [Hyphomonadaceae bacterium]|nr:hypothetical protein [Hyphomonadaceae bacterium]